MNNKVKFGLSNVHIAPIKITEDGTMAYDAPFRIPGAVDFTFDPSGDTAELHGDNTIYFNDSTNQGYTGTLEIAVVPDEFKTKILGQSTDSNGAMFENKDDSLKDFALGCQFEGDSTGTRYWFYHCSVIRPKIASKTIEKSKQPVTDTLNITASPRLKDGEVLAHLTKNEKGQEAYENFFKAVYEKVLSV